MMTNDAVIGYTDGTELLLKPWQQLAIKLSPLIGDSGFSALFGRAARLVSGRFPWLAPAPGKTIDTLIAGLRTHFALAGPAEATLANDALLATFTQLLTGLIGAALTMQLLDAEPAESVFKPVQEQQ